MPAREVQREIEGAQARYLMALLFLWATEGLFDAETDEDFSRSLVLDDYITPLSRAFGMGDADA
jgi:hypothetical protein